MSILKRSLVSIVGNTLKAVLSFSTGIVLARQFGPEQYGVFAFLLASFTAFRALLDMGTANAFFTFISKRHRSRRFFGYYILWLLFQLTLSLAFISVLAPDAVIESLWLGENRLRLLLVLVAVFLQQNVWSFVAQVGESQRLTTKVQALSIAIALFHLLAVIVLAWLDSLSIEGVLAFVVLEFVIAASVGFYLFSIEFSADQETSKAIFAEYWVYCLPLIPYTIFSVTMTYADTWLLQYYGGAVEQAYYAVASQFAAICLIATASVLRILWKEVAEANGQGDMEKVRLLFQRVSRTLYFVGAALSGFAIPWVSEITALLLGSDYSAGELVMMIMFIYPIHQSLGQLISTLYMALEMTKPYVVINLFFMVASTIAVYFMLAPKTAFIPGLGLASTGLAIKMVVLQFIFVNFSIWWLMKKKGWQFEWLYQFTGIALFLAIGSAVYYLISLLFGSAIHVLVQMATAGVLYCVACFSVFYIMPSFLNMTRDEIKNHYRVVKRFVSSKLAGH